MKLTATSYQIGPFTVSAKDHNEKFVELNVYEGTDGIQIDLPTGGCLVFESKDHKIKFEVNTSEWGMLSMEKALK